MADVIGMLVKGPAPNYDTWISPSDFTTRAIPGAAAISSANGTVQTIDFSYTAPEKPWVQVTSGFCGSVSMSFPSAGVARIKFDYTGTTGGAGTVIYGTS